MKPRSKIAWFFCLTLVLAGGLTFGIAESVLRAGHFYRCSLASAFPPLYVRSEARNHELIPNADVEHCSYYGDYDVRYHTDETGNRITGSISKEAKSAVILLGDSFTFGLGVTDSDTFAAQLQKMLVDQGNPKVINTGVTGYTIDEEAVAFNETLAKVKKIALPTCAVALQVTPDNDVDEISHHAVSESGALTDSLYRVDSTNRLNHNITEVGLAKRVLRNFYVYRFVAEDVVGRWRQPLNSLRGVKRQGTTPEEQLPENRQSFEKYFKYADRLIADVAALHLKLIVLIVPSENSANERALADYFKSKSGTVVLSGKDFLNRTHFLPKDPHFSADGHMAVARRLASEFQCSGFPIKATPEINKSDSE